MGLLFSWHASWLLKLLLSHAHHTTTGVHTTSLCTQPIATIVTPFHSNQLVHWTILLQLLGRISKRFRFHMQIDAMHALYQSTYERYLKSCAGLSAADLAAR